MFSIFFVTEGIYYFYILIGARSIELILSSTIPYNLNWIFVNFIVR